MCTTVNTLRMLESTANVSVFFFLHCKKVEFPEIPVLVFTGNLMVNATFKI